MTDDYLLTYYVIYKSPRDFPGKFVLRRWFQDLRRNECHVEQTCVVANNLPKIRSALPPVGLYNLGRQYGDDPVIKEVWV